MATQPETPMYVLVDHDQKIIQSAPNEEAVMKLACEWATKTDSPVYVYQKTGRMVPVHSARWEGPGN